MVRLARRLLLPLLLLNITTSANNWHVLGIGIGPALFWIIIATGGYLVAQSGYRNLGAAALFAALLLRLMEAATHDPIVAALRHAALGVLMMTAGASAFGRHPRLLARQLIVFMALCLPVMVLQLTGAHSFFMMWDTDPAHDPAILAIEEIGTFKKIPVHPTLWLPEEQLNYQMAQARPSGLLYANNVLSVFVAIAAALALATARRSRVGLAGLVVLTVLVLAMSMTAFAAVGGLYLAILIIGPGRWRKYVVKGAIVFTCLMWIYAQLFPGLFAIAFSREKLLMRAFTRGLGLFDMLGIRFLRDLYDWTGAYTWGIIEAETAYSGVEKILRSPLAGLAIVGAILALVWYGRAVRTMHREGETRWPVYPITAVVCVLTQFGVPYYGAPAFQVIFGFAMYPLYYSLWRARAVAPTAPDASRPVPATS